MRTTVKIEGLSGLEAGLRSLGTAATMRNVMRRALVKAGEPIAQTARSLVPVDSGQLKDSIIVSARLNSKVGVSEYAKAMRETQDKSAALGAMRDARRAMKGSLPDVVMYVGAGPVPHAHLVEFGSVHNKPQPFMRPAWDQHKDQLVGIIQSEMKVEIGKAAARAARKLAKAKAGK